MAETYTLMTPEELLAAISRAEVVRVADDPQHTIIGFKCDDLLLGVDTSGEHGDALIQSATDDPRGIHPLMSLTTRCGLVKGMKPGCDEWPYILAVTHALTEDGAQVLACHPRVSSDDILMFDVPMFDVICRPDPFGPNEAVAIAEVIKCVRAYYQRTIATLETPTGYVIVGPSKYGQTYGPAVALSVGIYAIDTTHFSYVGREGGDIIKIRKSPKTTSEGSCCPQS